MASTPPSPPDSDIEQDDTNTNNAAVRNPGSTNCWNGPTGWRIYFPGTNETDPDCKGRAEVVKRLRQVFINETSYHSSIIPPHNTVTITLDYYALSQRSSPVALRAIANSLQTDPDMSLSSLGLAACRAAEQLSSASNNNDTENYLVASVKHGMRIQPRILNFYPTTSLRQLKGSSIGTFVSVRGTVVRVSTIRQQLTAMDFRCGRCGEDQCIRFFDYKYITPTSCPTDKCRSRNFTPLRHTARTTDWQRIRIQELQKRRRQSSQQQKRSNNTDIEEEEEGRIPRTIDVEFFSDLIDSCVPGDVATISGIVKVMAVSESSGGGNQGQKDAMYYMYVEANSLSTMRSRTGVTISDDHTPAAATVHTVIHEVVREADPFGFLVHSAVPSIYGHELVKAGMLLALFGGSPKLNKKTTKNTSTTVANEDDDNNNEDGDEQNDNNNINNNARKATTSGTTTRRSMKSSDKVSIRRDAHVLVVGDPGLGKSQMLKAFCNLAPRGVYVCANTATTTGLTVTVVRESSGDFALEAGALVLGDGGVCCIDEFDKMGCDHGALLEAMEQQSVSVAKAGLLCNLSARTTVLAAANPVGGQYDRSKTVCENLKLARPLLSRFDLVFILVDHPDVKRDRFISDHVMKTFAMGNRRKKRKKAGSYGNGSANGYDGEAAWRMSTRAALIGGGGSDMKDVQSTGVRAATAAAAAAMAGTQAQAMARDHKRGIYSQRSEVIQIRDDDADDESDETNSLETRLKNMRVKDPLPPSLFREYVSYARTHVHPSLSTGAKKVLQSFYMFLRNKTKTEAADTTPVTTRQLESMIRLAEARARSVMRTVVTVDDARDVVEIMKKCMVTELTDGDSGVIDFGRASGMSRSSEANRFVKALDAEGRRRGGGDDFLFSNADLKRIAQAIGITDPRRFEGIVESVNNQGLIIKKGRGRWKLSSI